MPEVTVKYKNNKSLKALQDLAKAYDMVIETPNITTEKPKSDFPITYAEEPDVTALWGIWKDDPVSPEELRKNAWGDRL
jgi:hypothetical protein